MLQAVSSPGLWPTVALAGAAAALVAAPLLLARAWRRGADGRLARVSGWLALVAAAALAGVAAGAEIGIAWALAALPVPAWAWIWWHRDQRPGAARRALGDAGDAASAATAAAPATPRRGWRAALRMATALPLAGCAALLAATQLSHLAGSMSGGLVLALGLTVVLWALAALWAFSDPRPWRPAGALVLAGLAGALPLWLQ